MKLKPLLSILFFTVLSINAFAQVDYIVDLKQEQATKETKYTSHMYQQSYSVKDHSLVKGIPDICEKYALYGYFVDKGQAMYDRFRLGEISKESFKYNIDKYQIDTTKLSKDIKNGANSVFVYVGLDTVKGQKYVTIDGDGDQDFSNDSIYIFSLDEYAIQKPFRFLDSICPIIKISRKYYNGKEYVPIVASVVLDPFSAYEDNINKYPSKEAFYLNVLLLSNNYFAGSVRINNVDFTIHASLGTAAIYEPEIGMHSRYTFFDKANKVPNDYAIGDFLIAAERKLQIAGHEANKLYINDLGPIQDSCGVGDFIPQLVAKSIKNGEIVNLNPLMKDKFVFIDFWGSWCVPCIESLPKLVDLYDQVYYSPLIRPLVKLKS